MSSLKIFSVAVFTLSVATSVQASPVSLTGEQLDAVAAGGVEKVDGFVCPVITNANPSDKSALINTGSFYTVVGGDVSVPIHATNDNGAGSPGGPYVAPGDTSYTAIWAL